MQRSALIVAGALALAGAFFAGAAYAADPKFDEATALITKAVAALKAVQSPDLKKEADTHRTAALEFLLRAQGEIIKAKQFADAAPPPPAPSASAPKEPKPPTPKGTVPLLPME